MPRASDVSLSLVLALAACTGADAMTSATTTAGDTSTTSDSTTSTSATAGMSSTGASTTATTTTGTTTEGSTTATASGCGFVCESDSDGTVGFDCDPLEQECPEGFKCSPWGSDGGSWNATKCTPIDPDPDDVGDPCEVKDDEFSGVDSCAKGAICFHVDPETLVGVCVAQCQGDYLTCLEDPYACCPTGTTCQLSATGVLDLCFVACEPLVQDCAFASESCYWDEDTFRCAPDVSGDMGAPGDPCAYFNACDPGTHCGDPSTYPGCDPMASGCCIPFCELGFDTCPQPSECVPWFDPDEAPTGYEDLGACALPP